MTKKKQSKETIWVLTVPEEQVVRGGLQKRIARRIEMQTDTLAASVKSFVEHMGRVMSETPESIGEYELTEVEVSAEISTKGQLTLWGVGGGEVGAGGALKFTFRKRASASPPGQ